jgi:hypothetical protein
MFPTADEVGRSLAGSLKLLNKDAEGIRHLEISYEGFWHSFAAILLTAPAFVVAVAEHRLRAGLPPEAGLFSDPWLVADEVGAALFCWIAFPLALIGVLRPLGLGHRYLGYVVAYNWSAVIAAFVLAVPQAMVVLGLVPASMALLFGFAFGIVIVHYRWFMTKVALGVSGGVACLMVGIDLGLSGLARLII